MEPEELTDVARECYTREMDRRRLSEEGDSPDEAPHETVAMEEVEPDWLETAATACSFRMGGGHDSALEADQACAVLGDAGIPAEMVNEDDDSGTPCINVLVPGTLSLKASSVLDRDLFNQQLEEAWRTHFDHLSDEQLRSIRPDDLCAGWLDRAARLRRVYREALDARRP